MEKVTKSDKLLKRKSETGVKKTETCQKESKKWQTSEKSDKKSQTIGEK